MKGRLTHASGRDLLLLGVLTAAGFGALNAGAAEDISPFLPRAAASSAALAAGDADLDALVFSGLSFIGDEKSFNFLDSRSRKGFWVALNETVNGVTVVSFDPGSEQVVVRRGANTRTLGLRKAVLVAVPVSNPAPAPNAPWPGGPPSPGAPVATQATVAAARPSGGGVDEIRNPQTPQQIKQAEFEARMLVSDLLEISMQERARQRALREAQARGAPPPPAGNSTPPAAPR